eukprot:TRINITY_DN74691_c0_g1_i1.p1 TRINITY_DN74691_c0_g1~~TRINITY_DN74691_c0_g1_i1.p1  ORF type:complete len:1267 (+),score=207.94 TRINITY_DN74691_c0_g1_i1:26-3826(+)
MAAPTEPSPPSPPNEAAACRPKGVLEARSRRFSHGGDKCLRALRNVKALTGNHEDRREALSKLRNASNVNEALPLLSHEDREIRHQAVVFSSTLACSEIERSNAVEALIPRLRDQDVHVRAAALGAIEKVGQKGDDATIVAVSKCATDWNRPVRVAALKAVQTLAEPGNEVAMSSVAELLEDPSWEWRHAAANTLASMAAPGDSKRIEIVASRLENSRQEVREIAQDALPRLAPHGHVGLLETVAKRLESDIAFVRTAAGGVLPNLAGPPEHAKVVVDAVTARLEHADTAVRTTTGNTLAQLCEIGGDYHVDLAVSTLVEKLKSDDAEVRQSVIGALARVGRGNATAIKGATQGLQDENPTVRACSATLVRSLTFGQTNKFRERAAETVAEVLDNPNCDVQDAAGLALVGLAIDHDAAGVGDEGQGNDDELNRTISLSDTASALKQLRKATSGTDDAFAMPSGEGSDDIVPGKVPARLAALVAFNRTALMSDLDVSAWKKKTDPPERRRRASQQLTPTLVKKLSHIDWRVRQEGIQALSAASPGDEDLIDAVAELRADSLWQVRQAVAETIGKIGIGVPAALSTLAELARDWREDVAISALRGLAAMARGGEEIAIRAIAATLERWEPGVREAATTELENLSRARGAAAVPEPTAAVLAHADEMARDAATTALARVGPPASKAAIEKTEHDSGHTRSAAIRAVSRIDRRDGDSIDALLRGLEDVDGRVRHASLVALSCFGPTAPLPVVEGIIARFEHEDERVREVAVRTLWNVGEGFLILAVESLAQRLGDSHASVRDLASDVIEDFAHRCHAFAVGAVAQCLENHEEPVRLSAHNTLCRLILSNDPDAVCAVAARVAHSNQAVRRQATATLLAVMEFGYVDAVRVVCEHFAHTDEGVRADAVNALAAMSMRGDNAVIGLLYIDIKSSMWHVRQASLQALVRIALPSDEDAREYIVACIADREVEVRNTAVDAVEVLCHFSDHHAQVLEARVSVILEGDQTSGACIAALEALLRVAPLLRRIDIRDREYISNFGARAAATRLDHPDLKVRRLALKALEDLPIDSGAVDVAANAAARLRHSNYTVRDCAVEGLRIVATTGRKSAGHVASDVVRHAMAAAAAHLRHENWGVRRSVAQALLEISKADEVAVEDGPGLSSRKFTSSVRERIAMNDGIMAKNGAEEIVLRGALSPKELASAFLVIIDTQNESLWQTNAPIVDEVLQHWCRGARAPRSPGESLTTSETEHRARGRRRMYVHRTKSFGLGLQE